MNKPKLGSEVSFIIFKVYRSLVAIKTKYSLDSGDGGGAAILVNNCLVPKLVDLLKRPNSRIVDVSLSILGNMLVTKLPREQV